MIHLLQLTNGFGQLIDVCDSGKVRGISANDNPSDSGQVAEDRAEELAAVIAEGGFQASVISTRVRRFNWIVETQRAIAPR